MRSPLYTLMHAGWITADLAKTGVVRLGKLLDGNNDQAVRNVRRDIIHRHTTLRQIKAQFSDKNRLTA